MNLYEINNEILSLIDEETGEVLDFEQFEKLNMERETKLENIALWIKNLTAEAKALKEEKDSLAKRQKVAENKVNRLTEYLSAMLARQKFKTSKVSCSFRKSSTVEIEEGFSKWFEHRKEFWTIKEPVPNKSEIKKAILNGENVKFATIKENLNLNIK